MSHARKLFVAVAALLLCAVPPASAALPQLTLPAPTGVFPVGTSSVHLTDTSRPDPWVPENRRELMVTLWYPAWPGGERAQYMTPAESELLLKDEAPPGLPHDILSTVRTNAAKNAKPLGLNHSLPLIVLSPGYTKPRATLTSLAEDLASHGYVVAGIEHTYESAGTSFPDGRVVSCVSCDLQHDDAFWLKVGAGRAADVSFVLDELVKPAARWPGAALIDPRRMAMAGHSAGGASSIPALLNDSRLRAGVNIDGLQSTPVPDTGLARPFLFLGNELRHVPDKDPSWTQAWERLGGWKRWFVVSGTEHASFTDVGLLLDQVGADFGATIPSIRASEITRRYVRAFFDLHLRGLPQPLLDRPSAAYPELKFVGP
ncbi:alpha/beta hydrolase family protein [Amycolatopsis sp. NPDC059657]|uniref:alpha/beta hydrolase family protein n=1 Tax=Amycolatopsis sp. NPDC059657 TaxID=3346899 RepID=UPI00366CABC8